MNTDEIKQEFVNALSNSGKEKITDIKDTDISVTKKGNIKYKNTNYNVQSINKYYKSIYDLIVNSTKELINRTNDDVITNFINSNTFKKGISIEIQSQDFKNSLSFQTDMILGTQNVFIPNYQISDEQEVKQEEQKKEEPKQETKEQIDENKEADKKQFIQDVEEALKKFNQLVQKAKSSKNTEYITKLRGNVERFKEAMQNTITKFGIQDQEDIKKFVENTKRDMDRKLSALQNKLNFDEEQNTTDTSETPSDTKSTTDKQEEKTEPKQEIKQQSINWNDLTKKKQQTLTNKIKNMFADSEVIIPKEEFNNLKLTQQTKLMQAIKQSGKTLKIAKDDNLIIKRRSNFDISLKTSRRGLV